MKENNKDKSKKKNKQKKQTKKKQTNKKKEWNKEKKWEKKSMKLSGFFEKIQNWQAISIIHQEKKRVQNNTKMKEEKLQLTPQKYKGS